MKGTTAARPRVAVAATGVANLASVLAALERSGAEASAVTDPDELVEAEFAVLPGVGAFGAAAAALDSTGLGRAILERWRRRTPTLGVCLGMQLFFEGSEESPGAAGLGILGGVARRFGGGLPLPQLGWNLVFAPSAKTAELRSAPIGNAPSAKTGGLVVPGWAYFANSYRIAEEPRGSVAYRAEYGEGFVAALEAGATASGRPALLLCQFHPELSGRWGNDLLAAWLGAGRGGRP